MSIMYFNYGVERSLNINQSIFQVLGTSKNRDKGFQISPLVRFRTAHVTNKEVLSNARVERGLIKTMRKRRLQFLGHMRKEKL